MAHKMKWLILAGEFAAIWCVLAFATALMWGLLRRSGLIRFEDRR